MEQLDEGFDFIAKADGAEASGDAAAAREMLRCAIAVFMGVAESPQWPEEHKSFIMGQIKELFARADGLKADGEGGKNDVGRMVVPAVPLAPPPRAASSSSSSCATCGTYLGKSLMSRLGVTAESNSRH